VTDTVDYWAPPDYTPWWDETATVDAVLAQLRLSSGDVDEARIAALVPAAGAAINAYLDRWEPVQPAPSHVAQAALEQVTIELYRRKDAGAANPGDFSLAAVVTRYGSTDPLGEVRAQLAPYKRRWGVA
jgi:hypothetical protein